MIEQLKLSMLVVWLIVSVVTLFAIVAPIFFSADLIKTFVPKCEWKAKYNKECPLCGMTSSFIYISHGEFTRAYLNNRYSIYTYTIFMINEIVVGLMIVRNIKKWTFLLREFYFTYRKELKNKKEISYANN
ncbi:MAG TPA: DUF2752 domain-containing protein [Candidatus Hydrogenedens sp.]|nr:DUF2752 domain-containing protein [Candidatus Hydrogenedens sp.]